MRETEVCNGKLIHKGQRRRTIFVGEKANLKEKETE